jgi:hypothetical protein
VFCSEAQALPKAGGEGLGGVLREREVGDMKYSNIKRGTTVEADSVTRPEPTKSRTKFKTVEIKKTMDNVMNMGEKAHLVKVLTR